MILYLVGMENIISVTTQKRVYVAVSDWTDDVMVRRAHWMANVIRDRGHVAIVDFMDRSMKAQMRQAHKLSADYTLFVHPEEADE